MGAHRTGREYLQTMHSFPSVPADAMPCRIQTAWFADRQNWKQEKPHLVLSQLVKKLFHKWDSRISARTSKHSAKNGIVASFLSRMS
jgi:hypothetical protein